jgi:hypothetical protein
MYMVNLTYGSPLFAVTGSFICAKFFHFDLEQTGLFLGVPLTVGCLMGELSAGWVSDFILNTYAKRHDGYRKVEVRLWLLPLATLSSIGTALFGYCIQHHKPWIQAAVCMAVSGYGTQVIATMVYTYCCDSYKPQSSEISVIINVFKSRKFPCPIPWPNQIRDASIQSLQDAQSMRSTSVSTVCLLQAISALPGHLAFSVASVPSCCSSLYS